MPCGGAPALKAGFPAPLPAWGQILPPQTKFKIDCIHVNKRNPIESKSPLESMAFLADMKRQLASMI